MPGPSITAASRWRCRWAGRRLPVGPRCSRSTRAAPRSSARPTRGGRWRRTPAALPAVRPAVDTYASAGQLSVSLDRRNHPHAAGRGARGVSRRDSRHPVDRVRVGGGGILGQRGAPIGIDVEGHGRHEELGPQVDLSRTVGWFTTKYPVSLTVGGLYWAQVIAGEAALGAVVKDAKEQLRALPDPLTYGAAALPEHRRRPGRVRPGDRVQLPGTAGWRRPRSSPTICGGSARTACRSPAPPRAVPMPLVHTVELNAATLDTDAGPHLQANWTWAPSALDHAADQPAQPVVVRGPDRHLRPCASGGGGLTPSDIAPARLNQQQIDELQQQYEIADMLPLTPLQQGLLFHASTAHGHDDDLYAMQLDITVTGALDAHRLREAVHTVVNRHPNLAARFCQQFDEPVQIIPADPAMAWRYVDRAPMPMTSIPRSRSSSSALPNAPRSATWPTRRPSGRVDPHRSRPAPVCAHQSPHRARWLVAADPAAGNLRRLLRAAAARAGALPAVCDLAGRARPRRRPRGLARGAGRVRRPHPGRSAGPAPGWGGAACKRLGCPTETTRAAERAGPLAPHHRQHRAAGAPGRSC